VHVKQRCRITTTHLPSHPRERHTTTRASNHPSPHTVETSHHTSRSRLHEHHTATRQSLTLPEAYRLLVVLWNSVSPTSHLLVLELRRPVAAGHAKVLFDKSLPRLHSPTVIDLFPIVVQAQRLLQLVLASSTSARSKDQRQVAGRVRRFSHLLQMMHWQLWDH
jgi:hypothetical protein